jgi:hypothetical protein
MPLPLLALAGVGKSALSLAAGAEAARGITSKLAMFGREMDEGATTLARLAGGKPQALAGAPGQPPGAPGGVVHAGEVEPVVEHADQVLVHRKMPEWFVRRIVKVAFKVAHGVEYIWVQVLAVAPGRRAVLVGRLSNVPELLEAHLGDVVSFPMKDVIDVQMGTKGVNRRRRRR